MTFHCPNCNRHTLKSAVTVLNCFLLFLLSCNDKISDDFQTYHLSIESKEWLYAGDEGDTTFYTDNLNKQTLLAYDRYHTRYKEATRSTDMFSWFDEVIAKYETILQGFSFENGMKFNLELSATNLPETCELEILFITSWELTVKFNPNTTRILQVGVSKDGAFDEESGITDRTGYAVKNEKVLSEMIFYDSISMNNITYFDVLEFRLRDMLQYTDSLSVISFSIGKEFGLLAFQLRNGQSFERN